MKKHRSAEANRKMIETRKANKIAFGEQQVSLQRKKFTKKPRRVSLIQIDSNTYLLRIKD